MESQSRPSSVPPEQLLASLRSGLAPRHGAQDRVQAMMRSKMRAANPAAESLWSHVQDALTPAQELPAMLWQRIVRRLEPVYAPVLSRPIKWVAAFAVVAVVVRVSPLLFLAPPSIAESPVMLLPMQGSVEIRAGSFWQPVTRELSISRPTRIQTHAGAATLIVHDDFIVRLDADTEVSLYDLTDRPEKTLQDSTLALHRGRIWVLGLVPRHVRAVNILTSQGRVAVHEGSVSIQAGTEVAVHVWDRSAVVSRHGQHHGVMVGEQTALGRNEDIIVTKSATGQFQAPWVAGNLSRDAAHQREIAQLQQERRAAAAGILPGSTFYRVKRMAEKVDVYLTLTEEERARKLIMQANTRLNEAAALLGQGTDEQAAEPLQEYKDTLLQVASGSGGSAQVQALLQNEVQESATVSAALPGDPGYALKQTVNNAIAALPAELAKPDLEGAAILDQLSAAKRTAESGDTDIAREQLTEIAQSLEGLETTGTLALVPSETREEAKAIMEQVTASVGGPAQGAILQLGVPERAFVQPAHRNILARPLTPQQIAAKAQEIRGRIFVYGTKKGQYDALVDQLSLLQNHADRGSILRELAKVLPQGSLTQRVQRDIRILNAQVKQQVTSGEASSAAQ